MEARGDAGGTEALGAPWRVGLVQPGHPTPMGDTGGRGHRPLSPSRPSGNAASPLLCGSYVVLGLT